MTYSLENGEELHQKNNHRFQIPSRESRENVPIGSFAMLLFRFDVPGTPPERLWVKVTARKGKNYVGLLDSKPSSAKNLRVGRTIKFGPEHVLQIYYSQEEND